MVPRFIPVRAGAIVALVGATFGSAAAVTASAASAAPAAAPKPASSAPVRARIVSPSPDALISGRAVPVRVAVGRKVTAIKVFVGPKDISNRFTRRGNAYVASVPRTLVKTGANKLVVQALSGKGSGGAAMSTFIVDKPAARGAMSVSVGTKAAAAIARASGYTPTQGVAPVTIHTAKTTFAKLRVNGRRVTSRNGVLATKDHSWLVSPSDGLRPGRNTIKVESYDATGSHATRTFTVTRDTSLPLTEAGPAERIVGKNTWTQLDASKSRAARRGDELNYAWRVVKAPAGAKPVLRDANSAQPRFKPDISGTYTLALRATAMRKGVASAAAAGPAAEDAVTVDVAPALTRQGMYIGTDLEHGSDPDHYATLYYDGVGYASESPDDIDIALQLQADSLAPVQNGTIENVQPTAGTITIQVWYNHTWPGSSAQYGSRIYIGTDPVATNESVTGGVGNPYSNLHGWLQPASAETGTAKWISSDYLQVQTRNAGQATNMNTMTVNGHALTVTLPAGAIGGFQVVALDNAGNAAWAPDAFALTGDPANDAAVENTIASALQVMAANGKTLMVQGFGNISNVSHSLAMEFEALGGRSDTVALLNGKPDKNGGSYALISALRTLGGTPDQGGAEAAANRMGGGTLTALLSHDPKSNAYVVQQSDHATPDAARYRFIPELWAAPTSFGGKVRNDDNTALQDATPGEQTALNAIAHYADTKTWTAQPPTDPTLSDPRCPGAPDAIRGTYCVVAPQNLQNLKDNVADLTYTTTGLSTTGYTQDDFNVAQSTFKNELADVAAVRANIQTYQSIYGSESITAAFSANEIGQAIQSQLSLSQLQTASTDTDTLDALDDAFSLMEVIPEAGNVFSFMGGMVQYAELLGKSDQPVPSLPNQVELTAANAGATIGATFAQASDAMGVNGDYMVQDPAKLFTSAYDLSKGDLLLDTTGAKALTKTAAYGMRQSLWGTILSTSYAVWTGDAQLSMNPMCSMALADQSHPFNNMDGSGHWGWEAPNSNGATVHWWIAQNQTSKPDEYIYKHSGVGLPSAISEKLFGPIDITKDATDDSNNIGAVAPYFQLDNLPFMATAYVPKYHNGDGCFPDDYSGN